MGCDESGKVGKWEKKKVFCPKFCLSQESVAEDFQDAFITSGYRKPGMDFKDSLKSVFLPYCNECSNFWSHAVFLIYFAVRHWYDFTRNIDVTDPYNMPLVVLAIASFIPPGFSCFAHTFNSLSPYWRHKCFHIDYAGISIYGACASQAFFYYCRPMGSTFWLFRSPLIFCFLNVMNSTTTTFLCSLTTRKWKAWRPAVLGVSFAVSYLLASSPIIHRLLYCTGENDCDFRLYYLHIALLLVGVVAYGTHVPESLITDGTFDFVGNSHNLMHILTALGMTVKFEFVRAEMLRRKESLIHLGEVQPTFVLSFSFFLVILLLNLATARLVGTKRRKEEESEGIGRKEE